MIGLRCSLYATVLDHRSHEDLPMRIFALYLYLAAFIAGVLICAGINLWLAPERLAACNCGPAAISDSGFFARRQGRHRRYPKKGRWLSRAQQIRAAPSRSGHSSKNAKIGHPACLCGLAGPFFFEHRLPNLVRHAIDNLSSLFLAERHALSSG